MLGKIKNSLRLYKDKIMQAILLALFFQSILFAPFTFSPSPDLSYLSLDLMSNVRSDPISLRDGDAYASQASSVGYAGSESNVLNWRDCVSRKLPYRNPVIDEEVIVKLGIRKDNIVSLVWKITNDMDVNNEKNPILFRFNVTTADDYSEIMNDERNWARYRVLGKPAPMIRSCFPRGQFLPAEDRWVLDWAGVISSDTHRGADIVVIFAVIHDARLTYAKVPVVRSIGRDSFLLPAGFVNKDNLGRANYILKERKVDLFISDVKRELLEETGLDLDLFIDLDQADVTAVDRNNIVGTFKIKSYDAWRRCEEGHYESGLLHPYFIDICLSNTHDIEYIKNMVPCDKQEIIDCVYWDLNKIAKYVSDSEFNLDRDELKESLGSCTVMQNHKLLKLFLTVAQLIVERWQSGLMQRS